jgi:hypothetical protein
LVRLRFEGIPVGVAMNFVGKLNLGIVELDRGRRVVVVLRRGEVMEFQYQVP